MFSSFSSEVEDLPATQHSWEREETIGFKRPSGPPSGPVGPPSGPQRLTLTEPPRPWSLPGPRDMPERWVPSVHGTVPGQQTGSPTHLVIFEGGDALGAQRPSFTPTLRMSPGIVTTTAGTMTPATMGASFRYQPSVSEFPPSNRQPSTSSHVVGTPSGYAVGPSSGPLVGPPSGLVVGPSGPTSGPVSDTFGPSVSVGLQPGPVASIASRGQSPSSEPVQYTNGGIERLPAQSRDISPYHRQPSTIEYQPCMSPTSPLIILDDAAQQQAVAHRDPSPDIREVRRGRVRGRTHSRSRRRPRHYTTSRRCHRRHRDSSESSDSDYGYCPGTPRRATNGDGNPRHFNNQRTKPTVQPPNSFVYYSDGRVTLPAESRPAQEHIPARPAGSGHYFADGWTVGGTCARPAPVLSQHSVPETCPVCQEMPIYTYVTRPGAPGGWTAGVACPRASHAIGQRSAPVACRPPVENPCNNYVTLSGPGIGPSSDNVRLLSGQASGPVVPSSGLLVGPPSGPLVGTSGRVDGPVQYYQPSTVQQHDSPSIYLSQYPATSTPRRPDHPQGGASPPGGQPPPDGTTTSSNDLNSPAMGTATAVDVTPRRPSANVGVKLGTFDGNSCLDTFLASLRNFATYFKWSEEDELFHLRASLKGSAGQLLWDLGPNVKLAELVRLLRNRFGTSDQAERFRAELRTRKRRPGEHLQKLYNDICRLMSLAYPGPSSEIVNVVGREAFLDALGDPNLRVRILDKGPKNMEEALRIALNLEALDKSKEVEIATSSALEKPPKKDKYVKVAAQDGSIPSDGVTRQQNFNRPSADDGVIRQLQDGIKQCCSQMAQMQRDMVELKQQAAQPVKTCTPSYQPGLVQDYLYHSPALQNTGQLGNYSAGQHGYFEARPSPLSTASAIPEHNLPPPTTVRSGMYQQVPPAESNNPGTTPRRGGFPRRGAGRGRGPCLRCGQLGHWARNCTSSAQEPTPVMSSHERADEIRVVTGKSSKKDVYLPINLFGKKTVALLDTGCDTSVIGNKLLPKNLQLQASRTNLLAANGTKIPLLGELKITFKVAGKEHCMLVVVTEVIHEFILGADFLTAEACQWDFGAGQLLLSDDWVRLQRPLTASREEKSSQAHLRHRGLADSGWCAGRCTSICHLAKSAA